MTQFLKQTDIEIVAEFIKSSKIYTDILYSLQSNPNTTILFNPIESITLVDIFNDNPEEFSKLVKESFMFLSDTQKTKQAIKNFTNIIITDSIRIPFHEWSSEHEGRPVSVNCMIIDQKMEETYTKSARFVCEEYHQLLLEGIPDVVKCPQCRNIMTLDPNSIITGLHREVTIQEVQDEAKNRRADIFQAVLRDENVKNTHIGKRINIIGVFRSIPQKGKGTNKIVINILSMKLIDDIQEIQPTEPQKKFFAELLKQDNGFETIIESIAPKIKHEGLAKLCTLLALVGSYSKDGDNANIPILLVGDPEIGKTEILSYIPKLVKNSAFIDGSTATGTGITASLDTLPDKTRILRPGKVVTCHNGIVAIDEANQLKPVDYGKLFQVMQSMKLSYDKAGQEGFFEANTTICFGANPQYYSYKENHSIVDNIHMPEPLISRCALIVNMQRDKKNAVEESQIIDHINLIGRIGVSQYISNEKLLPPETLSAFIQYAKSFNPEFTTEGENLAKDFHLKMKALEQKEGSLSIGPRFLHAIRHISIAIARIFGSSVVTPDYVIMAIEIKKKTLQTFGMNVEGGQLQMKFSSEASSKPNAFFTICHGLEQRNPDGRFSEDECIKTMLEQYNDFFPTVEHAETFFFNMYNSGKVGKTAGRYKLD